ncbi:hypothetical protein RFI_23313, partial [Reticulomyxa filosa]
MVKWGFVFLMTYFGFCIVYSLYLATSTALTIDRLVIELIWYGYLSAMCLWGYLNLSQRHDLTPWFRYYNIDASVHTTHKDAKQETGNIKLQQLPLVTRLEWAVLLHYVWFICYNVAAVCSRIVGSYASSQELKLHQMHPRYTSPIYHVQNVWMEWTMFGHDFLHGIGMAFHYAFASSVVDTCIYNPHNSNKIDIARTMVFFTGGLDLGLCVCKLYIY